MSEDEPLDTEELTKCEGEMMKKITRLISLQPKSKEMAAASAVALANVMIMILITMVGREKAVEYAALIISRSFQILSDYKFSHEKDTDTKASGE